MIGETVTDPDGEFRVVAIDPDLKTVEGWKEVADFALDWAQNPKELDESA